MCACSPSLRGSRQRERAHAMAPVAQSVEGHGHLEGCRRLCVDELIGTSFGGGPRAARACMRPCVRTTVNSPHACIVHAKPIYSGRRAPYLAAHCAHAHMVKSSLLFHCDRRTGAHTCSRTRSNARRALWTTRHCDAQARACSSPQSLVARARLFRCVRVYMGIRVQNRSNKKPALCASGFVF